jgi:hypothetical protein
MPTFAPRFALEAGFLILLGAGAGYADLRPVAIVAILAGGWVLVALIELAVWRAQSRPAIAYPAASSPAEDVPEPDSGPESADGADYPLRDVEHAPSEEVEAYTRVLDGGAHDEPSGGSAAPPS